MTFFTIKNIGLLLLLGVLVFPVEINQSYAQTNQVSIDDALNTPPTTPDIAATAQQGFPGIINFSEITDDVDEEFADFTSVTFGLTNSSGNNPEPNLSTQVVFNSAHVDSSNTDDSILLVTSKILRFTVNADATLGVYNLAYTVTDSDDAESTGAVTVTIIAPLPNSAPMAPNIEISSYVRTTFPIPFGEYVTDTHSLFSQLEIIFTFAENDLAIDQVFVRSGATRTTEGQNDNSKGEGVVHEFLVTDENVGMADASGQTSRPPVPRTVVLTYTVSDGELSDTGTVSILIEEPTIITPLSGDVDDRIFAVSLESLPRFTKLFAGTEFANQLNLFETFGLRGFQILDVTVGIDEMGSKGGAATFTHNGDAGSFLATLTYIPIVGFSGFERFNYNATTNRGTATGIFGFNVEAVSCATSLNSGVAFGVLRAGVTSDTSSLSIVNNGNVPVQSLIAAENWVSAADTSIDTMNAGQTRYSVTPADAYDGRTPFTTTAANVGSPIAESESLDVYLQLLVDLMDNTFRGDTTQTMTVTSDCSVDP